MIACLDSCFCYKNGVAWFQRNNHNKLSYTLLITFLLFLGIGSLFVIFGCVLLLLGWIRDLVLSDTTCTGVTARIQLTECFVGGLSVIGLYMFNVLMNLFELGPILVVVTRCLGKIQNEKLRIGIFTLGCIVTFWIPILFNPLLGLFHRWSGIVPFEPIPEMKCQLGNFSQSINLGCSLEGIYPIGLGLMGFNLAVIICGYSIVVVRKCIVNNMETDEETRTRESLLGKNTS